MKKTVMAMALCLMSCLQIWAQRESGVISFTPKIGANISYLSGDAAMSVVYATIPESNVEQGISQEVNPIKVGGFTFDKRSVRFGWTAGLEVEYQMSRRWALAAEFQYSLQGANYDDVNMASVAASIKDITADLRCLNVPLLAKCYLTSNLAFEVGVQPGYVQSKLKCDMSVMGMAATMANNKIDYFSAFDLSVPVGISYQVNHLVVDARFNIGMTNLYNNEWNSSESPEARNQVLQLSVGYKFEL